MVYTFYNGDNSLLFSIQEQSIFIPHPLRILLGNFFYDSTRGIYSYQKLFFSQPSNIDNRFPSFSTIFLRSPNANILPLYLIIRNGLHIGNTDLTFLRLFSTLVEKKLARERETSHEPRKGIFVFLYISILLFKGSVHEIEVILGPTRIRNFFILSESAPKIEISTKLEFLIFAL